jgi:ribonucleoside-diphosphate reductase alpha chain
MNLFSEEIGIEGRLRVLKRGGQTTQDFSITKIERAIKAAFDEVDQVIADHFLVQMARLVKAKLIMRYGEKDVPVEVIQDFVETSLMETGCTDVAKAYILYRSKRENLRINRLAPDPLAISDYIHPGKYSRYLPELQRREVYEETVSRVEGMHINKFPEAAKDIVEAFDMVRAKKILPSMRSMQFAGEAIETVNARQYNCSFMHIDKLRAFGDALYLLLCGCGVGYSIQYDHVDKLPSLKHINPKVIRHYTIVDTIEGWANALTALMTSYTKGYYIEFNYSKVRPEGSPLKTSGGKAPGHTGLKTSLEAIRARLDHAQGRQLRPIECYDIMCLAADAVLSGGIRRSATIALFSLEDGEMMSAKTGNWFDAHPWRANSNNSAVLLRSDIKKRQFNRIFKYIKEFGEPGFVFTDNLDFGFNPCVEINLNPVLTIDSSVLAAIEAKRNKGTFIPKVKVGDILTGVAFCNLTEMNAAAFETPEDMYQAAMGAARLGTLQAAYTSFPYLGWVSELIAEREALLGVSMTGMMDSPGIALNPEYQQKAAAIVLAENARMAALLGVRPASRATCVKPSGTTSLELGCVGSGIHAHPGRRYIRRVTANELEPVFQYFRSINPHMCQKKPNGDWVIEFPVEAPEGAAILDDFSAIEFLETVRSTQNNWVKPGTADPSRSPGACHNVSNTVVVRPGEWDNVSDYVWNHKDDFSGISFLPHTGDKDYAFAPREVIATEADEEKWNQLLKYYTRVDYHKMVEEDDGTNLTGELACSGGKCEI